MKKYKKSLCMKFFNDMVLYCQNFLIDGDFAFVAVYDTVANLHTHVIMLCIL